MRHRGCIHFGERQGLVSEGCLVFFVLKLMSASYPLLPAVSLPRWFKGVGVRSTARKVRMGSKPMVGRGRAGCLKKGALCSFVWQFGGRVPA